MKKRHPEHVNLERWLVSYADFITLLFAFFVILYATSKADASKFKAAALSIRSAFGTAGPVGMIDLGGASGGATINNFEILEAPGGRALNLPAGKTNTAADPDPELQETRELLEETISLDLGTADTSDKLLMTYDARGLVVRVAVKDFFEENSAQVRSDLTPLLDRLGRVLARTRRLIRIEGHSDKRESNGWQLSAERAASIARYWVDRFAMDGARIGIAGYSHYRPLSEKKDEYARARNRRIEIIVLNSSYAQ